LRKSDCSCKFDEILLEALDVTLSTYGEKTRSAFYDHFKKAYNISKDKIPERIDEFSRGLEDLFGLSSKNLEIMVMMQLHLKIGVVWECKEPDGSSRYKRILPDLTFEEYVKFAKKYYEDVEESENQFEVLVTEKKAREIYR
jgi:hypothetical protein